jgi:hypothetical protein
MGRFALVAGTFESLSATEVAQRAVALGLCTPSEVLASDPLIVLSEPHLSDTTKPTANKPSKARKRKAPETSEKEGGVSRKKRKSANESMEEVLSELREEQQHSEEELEDEGLRQLVTRLSRQKARTGQSPSVSGVDFVRWCANSLETAAKNLSTGDGRISIEPSLGVRYNSSNLVARLFKECGLRKVKGAWSTGACTSEGLCRYAKRIRRELRISLETPKQQIPKQTVRNRKRVRDASDDELQTHSHAVDALPDPPPPSKRLKLLKHSISDQTDELDALLARSSDEESSEDEAIIQSQPNSQAIRSGVILSDSE